MKKLRLFDEAVFFLQGYAEQLGGAPAPEHNRIARELRAAIAVLKAAEKIVIPDFGRPVLYYPEIVKFYDRLVTARWIAERRRS